MFSKDKKGGGAAGGKGSAPAQSGAVQGDAKPGGEGAANGSGSTPGSGTPEKLAEAPQKTRVILMSVTASRDPYRRAGLAFGKEARKFREGEITEDQVRALLDDPVLTCKPDEVWE